MQILGIERVDPVCHDQVPLLAALGANTHLHDMLVEFVDASHDAGMAPGRAFVRVAKIRMGVNLQNGKIISQAIKKSADNGGRHGVLSPETYREFAVVNDTADSLAYDLHGRGALLLPKRQRFQRGDAEILHRFAIEFFVIELDRLGRLDHGRRAAPGALAVTGRRFVGNRKHGHPRRGVRAETLVKSEEVIRDGGHGRFSFR